MLFKKKACIDVPLITTVSLWRFTLSCRRSRTFQLLCLVFQRWCTGNNDSAAWHAASRARCRCPVVTDCSARAAPAPRSVRCVPNRLWSSSSLDLTAVWDHYRFQTNQSWFHKCQPRIPTAIWKTCRGGGGNNTSTDLVVYFLKKWP